MFSLVGKILTVFLAGVVPATIIATATNTFNVPPRQEHKLTKEDSRSSLPDPRVTVISKEQKIAEKEHDDCQDKNIKVVIQDNSGQKLTVPVKELSRYEGYKPVDVEYVVGTCSREKSK